MDIYALMSNVRLRLGDPRAGRPGDMQLLNAVCTQVRTVKRHHQNTSNPWDYTDIAITVVPNQARYIINAADFGTPLAVISYDPGNATWIARQIPFFLPQNMPYDWGWPNNIAASAFIPYDGSNCTAQRCCFFWTDNIPYIEFEPTPMMAAGYQIRYLQNVANMVDGMSLTQVPLQSADNDIVEVRAALSLLALTEWMAPDSKDGRSYNAERRKDLASTLMGEEAELRRQFEAASLITSGPKMSNRWNPAAWSG